MHSTNTFKYWHPYGAAVIFDPLERIQRSAFLPIGFLSKLKWKLLGDCPASYLKFSSAEVMDVEDKNDIPYNQQYLVPTSTKCRAYQFPPKATYSPKTMSIWTFSRCCHCLFIGFLLG